MTLRVLLLCLMVGTPAWSATRYALLVGTNLGDEAETPLRWAESDARRMKEALTALANVSPERTRLLQRPTLGQLQRAWSEVKGQMAEAALRGASETSYFRDDDALWVKLVVAASGEVIDASPAPPGGFGGGAGPGFGSSINVSRPAQVAAQ